MAMASFDDPAKINAALESIGEKFGAEGFDLTLTGVGEGEAMADAAASGVSLAPLIARLQAGFRQKLSRMLAASHAEQNELVVELDDPSFFREGSAEVHPNAFGVLNEVGTLLASEPSILVEVRGYADPEEAMDPDRLAARRAVAVVGRLRDHVPGPRLAATVYGTPAVDPMQGAKGWRRRVGLIIRTDTAAGRTSLNDLNEGKHGQ